MPTDFITIDDVSNDELAALVEAAHASSRGGSLGSPLAGRSVALLFEKPSLRTKVSFDIAVHELGGHPLYLGASEVGLDTREPVEDVAHVLEQWVAAIVARVFAQSTLTRFAATAGVPVVNALSDHEHPCQAVADVLTATQRLGPLAGRTVAYVGDANNCARSLGLAAVALGARFTIAAPEGYGFDAASLAQIDARMPGHRTLQTPDPAEAVRDASVVYTDVWTSMGQEAESAVRLKAFAGFQVNPALLAHARPEVILLHPMPAHYGEEVPAGMLDHPASAAYQQAGNRLHAQKAVIALLTGAGR